MYAMTTMHAISNLWSLLFMHVCKPFAFVSWYIKAITYLLTYLIQTTPEYTIPENLAKIDRIVSEHERWIKNI